MKTPFLPADPDSGQESGAGVLSLLALGSGAMFCEAAQ